MASRVSRVGRARSVSACGRSGLRSACALAWVRLLSVAASVRVSLDVWIVRYSAAGCVAGSRRHVRGASRMTDRVSLARAGLAHCRYNRGRTPGLASRRCPSQGCVLSVGVGCSALWPGALATPPERGLTAGHEVPCSASSAGSGGRARSCSQAATSLAFDSTMNVCSCRLAFAAGC